VAKDAFGETSATWTMFTFSVVERVMSRRVSCDGRSGRSAFTSRVTSSYFRSESSSASNSTNVVATPSRMELLIRFTFSSSFRRSSSFFTTSRSRSVGLAPG